MMTLVDRAAAYNAAHPDRPPLVTHTNRAGKTWLYGIWEIGNDYRNRTEYFGGYPRGYVERVQSMFPDKPPAQTLHLFSGSLQCPGVRVDVQAYLRPTVVATAMQMPFVDGAFDFAMVDPPYSKTDAEHYGVPLPNKRAVMRELARVTRPGGFVAWLDIPKPMYRKDEWDLCGEIGILRSTNHRGRFLFLFARR